MDPMTEVIATGLTGDLGEGIAKAAAFLGAGLCMGIGAVGPAQGRFPLSGFRN